MKRGQISIFILIGLLILLFIGFFVFYMQMGAPSLDVPQNPIVQSVQAAVTACLETQLQEVITTIALHGGYFETPDVALEKEFTGTIESMIPYYFYTQENIVLSEEELEEQVALSFQENIKKCTDFSEYPYSITSQATQEVKVTIAQDSVAATVTLPLTIESENAVYSLDTFPIEISSSLFKLYTTARAMTTEQSLHPEDICMTCISDIATSASLYVGIIELQTEEKYAILYVLNDRDIEMQDELSFYFAHGFLTSTEESVTSISSIQRQIVAIGYPFSYQVTAIGDNITFLDSSPIFDINQQTGFISFTPDEDDIGSWIVTITTKDKQGNEAETSFVLEIEDVVASELSLEPLLYFVGHAGEEFNYTVEVTANQTVYFFDDSTLFDIDTITGIIQFTPHENDVGSHNFTITAIDIVGNSDAEEGYMVITE